MITYNLSDKVVAFTTDKTEGRDAQVLCKALGIPSDMFFRPHQVHGTDVMVITEQDVHDFQQTGAHGWQCDAVIYSLQNTCIGISTADCIPVICYDPEHHCAAAIHAGWRGTVAGIIGKAIEKMTTVYGTNPSLLRCAIGPGISLDSFEVGDEVYNAFRDAGYDMEKMSKRYPANNQIVNSKLLNSRCNSDSEIVNSKLLNSKYKWHLDIKECNRMQLIACGIKESNIHVSDIDTMTDERFYSARREGAKTGRILSGIMLL